MQLPYECMVGLEFSTLFIIILDYKIYYVLILCVLKIIGKLIKSYVWKIEILELQLVFIKLTNFTFC